MPADRDGSTCFSSNFRMKSLQNSKYSIDCILNGLACTLMHRAVDGSCHSHRSKRVTSATRSDPNLSARKKNANQASLSVGWLSNAHALHPSPSRQLEAQRSSPGDTNQGSLAEALSRFKDLYADYGKHRKKEVGCFARIGLWVGDS